MKVSVIIPVYNVKPYLERCVQSVLGQTYKDIEMILVDDGSTDGSGDLCDQLASKVPVVTAVHQANQGISGARNTGILHAKGQYIAFLDADDAWLLPNGLEQIMQKVRECELDLVVFKAVHIWNGKLKNYTPDYDINRLETFSNSKDVFAYLVRSQQFSMSACFILVCKQLLTDNNIYFPIGYHSEDVYWSLRLWQFVQNVKFLNIDFYGYYHREASVSTTASISVYESYDKIFSYWKPLCDVGCKNSDAILAYLADMWINRGYNYYRLTSSEKQLALIIQKKHSDLLNYGVSPKAKRSRLMVKIFGVRFTVTVLGWYWQLRNRFNL